MRIEHLFPEPEREAIRAAVSEAEASGAAIVPYVVGRSDNYPQVAWKLAALGAVLGAIAGELSRPGWDGSRWPALILPLSASLAGILLARIPGLRRWLAGKAAISRRVEARAREAFTEKEVFKAAGRDGVLIFVSALEKRVLVLPDRVARERAPADAWSAIAGRISTGIRSGAPGRAVADGVRECAKLLAGTAGGSARS